MGKKHMAIFHCQAKAISRGAGRSATAAAAYRSGEIIEDFRTGEVYDYSRKQGICYTAILTSSREKISRSELWNLAEAAEKRKDAKVAREWEIALPAELTELQQRELALSFARALIERYGIAADVCIHAPGKEGDHRNHHAHILTTTRTFTSGALGAKTRVLDSPRTSGKEVEAMRQAWASLANEALERAGHSERIDPRSLAAQGVARIPTVHLGPIATAMERRGIQTERGDLNRLQDEQSQEVRELVALEELDAGINRVKVQARAWRKAKERAAAEEARERQQRLEQQATQEKHLQESLVSGRPEVLQGQQHPLMASKGDSPRQRETDGFLHELKHKRRQREDKAREAKEDQQDSWMGLGL